MKLLVDVGNNRLKWAWLDGDELRDAGSVAHGRRFPDGAITGTDKLHGPPGEILVASVAAPSALTAEDVRKVPKDPPRRDPDPPRRDPDPPRRDPPRRDPDPPQREPNPPRREPDPPRREPDPPRREPINPRVPLPDCPGGDCNWDGRRR